MPFYIRVFSTVTDSVYEQHHVGLQYLLIIFIRKYITHKEDCLGTIKRV